MKRLVLAALLVFGLAGCNPGESVDNENDSIYQWSYVNGPNGERCLVASYFVSNNNGTSMMDCDWSTAQ